MADQLDSPGGEPAPTVLHVDDSAPDRYRRRRALERFGFRVIEAASGDAALAKLAAQRVDLVLLDVRLPDVSGFELGRRVKQQCANQQQDVAVILISTYFTDSDARVQGLESGADAYLIEPVPDQELVATLRAMARLLRQLRQARQMEGALVEQAKELRAADQAKNDFLASVVHELRQPIQAIVSAIAVMKARTDRRTGERARDVIERQAQQMSRIAEDLLDAAKLVRGQVPMTLQPEDLRDVVRRALETVRPAITEREQQLTVTFPDDRVTVLADAGRLQQVFVNVLSNAVRYTQTHGRIGIEFKVEPSRAAVHVTDSGAGIAQEHLPRIFDLFTRASSETAGLGIGLAVARTIIDKHAGRIEAHSPGAGLGSEFIVTLPTTIRPE